METATINTAICSCGHGYIYRDDLCKICLLKKRWQTNTDINNLGIYSFFKGIVPAAFKHFKYSFPEIHKEILWEVLRDEPNWRFFDRQIVVAAPRGISKTTLISKGYVLFCAVFKLKKYIVISSKTGRTAQKTLRWIKQMLGKTSVISIFGDLRPDAKGKRLEVDTVEGKWTNDIVILSNGVTIEAIGMGQQLRSAAEGEDVNRVDLFIADDSETDENTRTPDRRETNEVWLFETVLPSLDVDTGTIIFINTQTHTDSILSKLLKAKGWRKKFYQITKVEGVDAKGNPKEVSIWPEKFPMHVINSIRESYKQAGRLNSFYKEYYNLIRSERGFDEKWIRRYTGLPFVQHGRKWIRVKADYDEYERVYPATMSLGIDSSFSFSESADFTVLTPIALTHDWKRFIFPQQRGRFTTYDQFGQDGGIERKGIISEAIRLHEMYNFDVITIDTTAQQVGLYILLEEEFRKRYGGAVRIFPDNASREKRPKLDKLVNYLQPKYEAGLIHHPIVSSDLDRELISIGDSTDDCLDSLYYADKNAYPPEGVVYNPIMLPRDREMMVRNNSLAVRRDWMTA